MRSPRLFTVLLAVATAFPAALPAQLTPLSEVFPVWLPREGPVDSSYGPYGLLLPDAPTAISLGHAFAIATRSSTGGYNAQAVDGKLLDLSGQTGPQLLGELVSDPNAHRIGLSQPAGAAAGAGGLVLAWTSGILPESAHPWDMLHVLRFAPGVASGETEELTRTRGFALSLPAVAGNAAGEFAVAWGEGNDIPDCYESHCDKPFTVSVQISDLAETHRRYISGPVLQQLLDPLLRVGMDATGRVVLLWQQAGAAGTDPVRLCGQAYDAAGQTLGASFCAGQLGSTAGALAVGPAGRFLAAWFGLAAAGAPAPLFVRRYRMNGTALGGPVQVAAAAGPSDLAVSADAHGDAALSWLEGDRLRVLLLRHDGVVRGPAIAISGVTPPISEYFGSAAAALDASGRVLVTWRAGDRLLGQIWKASF